MNIRNDAGERIATADSDTQACRWFIEEGRWGDHLEDTGELLEDLTRELLGVDVRYDRNDCVVVPEGQRHLLDL